MSNEDRDIFSIIGKLPKYSKLLFRLYKSPDISRRHKFLLSMGIAYSVSPFDLIPGIIPVAGQLDNLLVILRCLRKVLGALKEETREKYLQEASVTIEEIDEDIELAVNTLKSIGKGTAKVVSNTMKFAGYSALHGYRKLRRKKPF